MRITLKQIAALKREIAAAPPARRRVLEAKLTTMRHDYDAQARAAKPTPPYRGYTEPDPDEPDDDDDREDDDEDEDEDETEREKSKEAATPKSPSQRRARLERIAQRRYDALEPAPPPAALSAQIARLETVRGIEPPAFTLTPAAISAYRKAHPGVSVDAAIVHLTTAPKRAGTGSAHGTPVSALAPKKGASK